MRRRDVLAAGALSLSLSAGCLDALEREDAWRELVVDPPEGVYVPPKVDEMATFGTATADGLAVTLTATQPHSFWTVTGPERARADVRDHHAVHLMATVTDLETGLAVPTSVTTTIRSRGERVEERTLWPMLSQRMGFHHGDNAALGEDGPHVATVRIEPTRVETAGAIADRLERSRTVDVEFEYAAAEIESLGRRLIDEDEGRGEPGAVEPMARDHGSGDGRDGHGDHGDADSHGDGREPALEDAVDAWLGTARSGDLEFGVGVDGSGSEAEVVATARTRYNGFSVPFAGLSIAPVREDGFGERTALTERLEADRGHHYGAAVDRTVLEAAPKLAVIVDAAPQLSRHEGYETAFFDLEPATVEVALE
ncbi:DUF7350 domain-containing protein [Natronococcus jeotgali]|uniref:DUF7350 domain-containing protein n=1 Tax=Natronococcus jeotgali DSM 18795 TaxID=1227498 RepID=L9WNL7_9EURY|nr:hypothetical protein [Natronococcus jeotgali]ELY50821.1 hypothetical protein C492_21627 [Natronococcus jeotgali DSM 18795]